MVIYVEKVYRNFGKKLGKKLREKFLQFKNYGAFFKKTGPVCIIFCLKICQGKKLWKF